MPAMLADHPAVTTAEQIVRAYRDHLKAVMLWQVHEFWQEYRDLAYDAPHEAQDMALGNLRNQLDLYRQTWGEEPEY
jgi:hypothetical protein